MATSSDVAFFWQGTARLPPLRLLVGLPCGRPRRGSGLLASRRSALVSIPQGSVQCLQWATGARPRPNPEDPRPSPKSRRFAPQTGPFLTPASHNDINKINSLLLMAHNLLQFYYNDDANRLVAEGIGGGLTPPTRNGETKWSRPGGCSGRSWGADASDSCCSRCWQWHVTARTPQT